MGGRRIVVVLVAAGIAVWAAPTHAQPDEEIEMDPVDTGSGSGSGSGSATPDTPATPTKDPKQAKKLVAAAQQLIIRGDYFARLKKPDDAKAQYDNAVTAYKKAIELGDDLNVYYDLGVAYDKLGKTDEAAKIWRTLTKAPNIKPDVVKKSTTKLEEALTRVGTVTLQVQPEGAVVTLAGVEIGKAPLPEPLILMPGAYTFSIALAGYQPKDIELKVEAGSESERGIELEPEKIVVAPIKPKDIDEPVKPPPPTPPSKLVLYVGGGATAALLTATAVTGLLAVGKHGTFTSAGASAGEREDAQSSGKSLARISDISLVGTLVAGGFTTYWYLFKYKPAQRKFATEQQGPQRPNVTVVPWVQHDTGGVSFAGWF